MFLSSKKNHKPIYSVYNKGCEAFYTQSSKPIPASYPRILRVCRDILFIPLAPRHNCHASFQALASPSSTGRMPLPGCDASLGSMSVPARVAWHGLAWLLMAYFGTALLLIPFRACSTAVFWSPLAHQAPNLCFAPAEITPLPCLHPPNLPVDAPWCRADPGWGCRSPLLLELDLQAHLAVWRRQPQGAGGSVLTATSLLPPPGL